MSCFFSRWAAIIIGASAAMSMAACAPDQREGSSTVSLRVGAATAVMRESSIGLTYLRNALSRETLVTIGGDGRVQPRILESWRMSPDGLTWKFKVRAGVRFHDGTAVTAADLAPQVAAHLETESLGAVQSVTAEAGESLRITLNEPYAFLFEDLAVMSAQRTVNGQTFGTGPYEEVDQSSNRLSLKAVRDHYRGQPAIDRVEVQVFPDQRNAWSALMRDQVDMLYEVNRDSLEFVRGESGLRVASFPRPYVYLLGLNVLHPLLADKRVRQALDRAVDREELVRVAMSGEGEPAQGHVFPRHWAYDANAGTIRQDQRAALQLLEGAGLEVRTAAGRMPSRLRLKCLVYEPLREIALVLQRQLAQVDIDLQIELASAGQLIAGISSGNFESFLFEMTSLRGFKFPYQFWHSGSPFLKHGYRGADDVLLRIRRASDEPEFLRAASDFQRRLHEDPPAVFLAWGRTSRAVSTRYEIPDGDEDIYHTIARWKLAVPVKP